jgi:uncharacterized damage-inducible protein DinB
MPPTLTPRVGAIIAAYDAAHQRLAARLTGVTDEEAATVPAGGGWSAAQIAEHVAAFDRTLARIVAGSLPAARQAPSDFTERPWSDILGTLADRFEAPGNLQPSAGATREAALAALDVAAGEVRLAFRDLTDDRAALTLTHPRVGTITLLQVGDWLVAHTIRHNAQMKRAVGR